MQRPLAVELDAAPRARAFSCKVEGGERRATAKQKLGCVRVQAAIVVAALLCDPALAAAKVDEGLGGRHELQVAVEQSKPEERADVADWPWRAHLVAIVVVACSKADDVCRAESCCVVGRKSRNRRIEGVHAGVMLWHAAILVGDTHLLQRNEREQLPRESRWRGRQVIESPALRSAHY